MAFDCTPQSMVFQDFNKKERSNGAKRLNMLNDCFIFFQVSTFLSKKLLLDDLVH